MGVLLQLPIVEPTCVVAYVFMVQVEGEGGGMNETDWNQLVLCLLLTYTWFFEKDI